MTNFTELPSARSDHLVTLTDQPRLAVAAYLARGPDYYQSKIDKNRRARNHIRQLEALGYTVTITQAA